jgi:hypothetical protein
MLGMEEKVLAHPAIALDKNDLSSTTARSERSMFPELFALFSTLYPGHSRRRDEKHGQNE